MSVTTLAPLPPARGRAGLPGALRSEWTKLRSVRSTFWSLLAMAVIAVGLTSLIAWQLMRRWDRLEPGERLSLTHNPLDAIIGRPVFISQIVIAVLGVMVVSAEYTTGMIRSTLQSQPRRLTVLTAKVLVFAALMLVVGEVVSFVAFFTGRALVAEHITVRLSDPGVTRSVIGAGLFIAVLGLFSLAFGAILRHTAGAITAVLGTVLILTPLTQELPDSWGAHIHAWMPTNAGSLIFEPSLPPDHLLTQWQGFAVFCGWTALLLVIAAVLMRTRDA
jgi:ABC-type transport system involved in multi-copper enzyme maturation permease subunit